MGCSPGAGQPTRSHEQARTGPPERLPGGLAPVQTGQPRAAYRTAATAVRSPALRRLPRSTDWTN